MSRVMGKEIDMLDFEAVKEEVEVFVDSLIEKDRAESTLWNGQKVFVNSEKEPHESEKRTRLCYEIGTWKSNYSRLVCDTNRAIEAITAMKADWLANGHDQPYVEGVVYGLKRALEVLTSKIK